MSTSEASWGSIGERLSVLYEVFRPSAPVDHQDLFSGRTQQLMKIMSAVNQPGRHAVVYGERGVGKTSLVRVAAELQANRLNVRVACDQGDNFATIWTKIGEELSTRTLGPDWQALGADRATVQRATEFLNSESIWPDRVRHFLRILSQVAPVIVYIDEFDRVGDAGSHALIADTIKALSDDAMPATVVIVGVADDIEQLITEHASIERALAQIPMPRMTPLEVQGIFDNGFGRLGLTCSPTALRRLVALPQGLPHFAHQLGLEAAEPTIYNEGGEITDSAVQHAVTQTVVNTDESMRRVYTEATTSSHDTLYKPVLLACALTPGEDLGYFAMGDVRGPMHRITGETYEISRFARHMVQFCDERGPVLERRGGERRWRYRFINPMMRPYVVMRAYDEGMDEETLGLTNPIEPEPLF